MAIWGRDACRNQRLRCANRIDRRRSAPTSRTGRRPMVARDYAFTGTPTGDRPEPTRVLLIEDDDGDAFLVDEFLREVEANVDLRRVRSLAEAKVALAGTACVLLDLGLPDTHELDGLRWLQENVPEVAVV